MSATRYRRNMTTESSGPSSFVRSGLSGAWAHELAGQWNLEAEAEGQDYRHRVVYRTEAEAGRDGGYAVQRYEIPCHLRAGGAA